MVLTLIEELYIYWDDQKSRTLVAKLRGEASGQCPTNMLQYDWNFPREALAKMFDTNMCQRLRLTYRGLRRIEELRELPAKLIEVFALRVNFGSDDFLMLFEPDGAFLFVVDGGPLAAGNDCGREPVHIQGEVVGFAQIGICRNGSLFQDFQEVLGLSLDEQPASG